MVRRDDCRPARVQHAIMLKGRNVLSQLPHVFDMIETVTFINTMTTENA